MNLRNHLQTPSHTTRIIRGMRKCCGSTNRQREYRNLPQRPTIRPVVFPRHRNIRLTWCMRHIRLPNTELGQYSRHRRVPNESRFHLDSSGNRARVYYHEGERCSGQYFVAA